MAVQQRSFYIETSDTPATLPTGFDEMYVIIPETRRGPGYMHSLVVYGSGLTISGVTLTMSAWIGVLGDVCLIPETTGIAVHDGQTTAGAWSAVVKVDAAIPATSGWNGQIGIKLALSAGAGNVDGVRLIWEG